MVVARQLTAAAEDQGHLQEAEAHQVRADRDAQVYDPHRHFEVLRHLSYLADVPHEVGPERTHDAREQRAAEQTEQDHLAPSLDAQHVDEDIDADVDARAHAIGRAELAHPHEHVDAQLLGPGEIPGSCIGIEGRDTRCIPLDDGEEDYDGGRAHEDGDERLLQAVQASQQHRRLAPYSQCTTRQRPTVPGAFRSSDRCWRLLCHASGLKSTTL